MDEIKVGITKDIRFNRFSMECMAATIESGYEGLLDIIKSNMKGKEYEVNDADIIIEKDQDYEVASICIDEQDITVKLKPLDETEIYLDEYDLESLNFKYQMNIINYLITKVENPVQKVSAEDLKTFAKKIEKDEDKNEDIVVGESEWR